jgi:uncharacterized protein DUF2652
MSGDWKSGDWMSGVWIGLDAALVLAIIGAIILAILLRRVFVGDAAEAVRHGALRRVAARHADGTTQARAPSMSGEVEAFLIIPDISGYTEFMQLSHFSLAHAQYAVSSLLESIIEAVEDFLATAKVEGDAVFLYAVRGAGDGGGGASGPDIARAIGHILKAFYTKRAELTAKNTCPCEACRHVDRLELKTVLHFGRLLLYDLRGQQELSGLPVIVAHRLLKNSLGLNRYVMISAAAHEEVALPLDANPTRHVEKYEGIGEIATYVHRFDPDTLARDGAGPLEAGIAEKAGEAMRKLGENLRTLRS